MGTRDRLMKDVQMYDFALYELALYLDTHPSCPKALDQYRKYKALRENAANEYINLYGPLNISQVDSTDRWTWIDEPWPWERSAT